MEERYRELLARGLRKIRREDGLPLHLVVCDELAFYLTLPDKDQRKEFAELLRDLVARGRAAGVIVVRGDAEAGHGHRCRARCAICSGSGWRCAARRRRPRTRSSGRAGRPTARTRRRSPARQRGVGYLLAEGERPVRMRGYYLDDDAVTAIAERAAARRTDEWLDGGRERMTAVAMPAGPVLADVLERAADPEVWERFERQLRSTGYCRRPVRLRGQVDAIDKATGEVVTVYSTEHEPDETLLTCCGNRREAVCPSCANTYRGDAFQLVATGMRGGKGVPESVAERPLVFLTLTAPSFGPVHSRRVADEKVRRCRPRRER